MKKKKKENLYLGFLRKLIEDMPQGNEGVNQGRGTGQPGSGIPTEERGEICPRVRPGSLRGCDFYMIV